MKIKSLFSSIIGIIIFLICPRDAMSQQKLDSLKQVLSTYSKTDSNYVLTELRLASAIRSIDPEQSVSYATQAAERASRLQLKRTEARALNILGISLSITGKYEQAIGSFLRAISLGEDVGYGLLVAEVYNNLGITYRSIEDYPRSLEYYLKAEKAYDSLGFDLGLARVSNNLGNVFKRNGQWDKAESSYRKAQRQYAKLDNKAGYHSAQLNLGLILFGLKKYEEAKIKLDSALNFYVDQGNTIKEILARNALGNLHIVTKEYKLAQSYISQGLNDARSLGLKDYEFYLLANQAELEIKTGQTASGLRKMTRALALADSLQNKSLLSEGEKRISDLYAEIGKWKEALAHYKTYQVWQDSIFSQQQAKAYQAQQIQREVFEKEKQIASQASQMSFLEERIRLDKLWKLLLAIVSVLLLLVGVLYYQRYRNRRHHAQQMAEQVALRERIDETVHYFSGSLYGKNKVDEILWDLAKNCIAQLGLVDCVIYLLNEDGQKLTQVAAYGPKNPKDFDIYQPIEIPLGEGIVGSVAKSGKILKIDDITQDPRYIQDGEAAGSEIAVPLLHKQKVIGIIDSEHPKKGFFNDFHVNTLRTIAIIAGGKIAQAMADEEAEAAEKVREEAEHIKYMDQVKTQFFTNISHEFRTPLNLILGPLRTHQEKIPDSELGMMQRNAERLLRLVNQLLDLSKLEVGELHLNFQNIYLFPFLSQLALAFRSQAELKDIRFQIDLSQSEEAVQADPDKLEKILYNLLSNAFKFTPKGGTVSLHAMMEEGNRLRLVVSDTGLGIPPEMQERIFERFFQADSSSTRQFEGTGIGLALTKELVELHGGQISLDSKVKKGCRFTVLLPLKAYDPALGEALSPGSEFSAEVYSPDQKSENLPEHVDASHILLVEDHEEMRHYLKKQLEADYIILQAANGVEGLENAKAKVPDLIITDMMMPEMDGMELIQKLKADPSTSHIPVIMLTAKDDPTSRKESFQYGADQYISKPFDPAEVQARIHSLLKQTQRLREKYSKAVYLEPTGVEIEDKEAVFLSQIKEIVEANIDDHEFAGPELQKEMAMSRMQLHRKLKALTGRSTGEFIRYIRLQRAAELLKHPGSQVSDVAYQVGFNHLSYFAKCFKEEFGQTPSNFAQQSR